MKHQQSMLARQILSEQDIANKIRRLAFEILEKHSQQPLAFVGIHTRGVVLCQRVFDLLAEHHNDIRMGTLDIALYRDDLDNLGSIAAIKGSDIPFSVEGAHIILFDDVLFTGRTIRAAIDELIDYGRPARIELAVLVDRGNRELPIAADYCGLHMQTSRDEYVGVKFKESDDGEEGVYQFIAEAP